MKTVVTEEGIRHAEALARWTWEAKKKKNHQAKPISTSIRSVQRKDGKKIARYHHRQRNTRTWFLVKFHSPLMFVRTDNGTKQSNIKQLPVRTTGAGWALPPQPSRFVFAAFENAFHLREKLFDELILRFNSATFHVVFRHCPVDWIP